jgi:hypothetical protein
MTTRSFTLVSLAFVAMLSGCASSYQGTTVERAQGFVRETQKDTACLYGVESGTRNINVDQGTSYDITVGRSSRHGSYYNERQSYYIDSRDSYKCRTEPLPQPKGKK